MLGAPALAQLTLPAPPPGGTLPAASRVQVHADPRVELMSLLLSRTKQGKLQQGDLAIAYRSAAATAFAALDAHPAVRMLEELQAQGFVGIYPYRFALALSEPGMTLDQPLPPELAGSAEPLTALAHAVAAYAAESRFMEFWAAHGSVFAGMDRKIVPLLVSEDVMARVEAFYGTRWDRYTIIPSPLMGVPQLGIPVTHPDGSREVICVVGPLGATSRQEADYYQPQGLALAVEAALGQGVVAGLSAQFQKDVTDTQELYGPLSDRLTSRGLATWSEALNEHLLRAIGARMLQARGRAKEAQLNLHRHERLGYLYVRKFYEALSVYEGDRASYPTLESFYPRLMATLSFWKDAGEHQRIATRSKLFKGPIASAVEERYLPRAVLVRPEPTDPALKKQADDFVTSLTTRYRDKYGITLPVMTSDQAAKADLTQTVFLIYGTPDSNAYLRALLKHVPIKVSKGDLHLGARQFKGTDLRLVTAIPNPYNPTLPIVIVTGTSDSLVLSDVTMSQTQTDFVLYKGAKLQSMGDFLYDEKGSWRVQ